MCLGSTKQSYTLLVCLDQAGKDGLAGRGLIDSLKRVSGEKFGTEQFALNPVALTRVLETSERSGAIAANDSDNWQITDFGKKHLALLKHFVTEDLLAPD